MLGDRTPAVQPLYWLAATVSVSSSQVLLFFKVKARLRTWCEVWPLKITVQVGGLLSSLQFATRPVAPRLLLWERLILLRH